MRAVDEEVVPGGPEPPRLLDGVRVVDFTEFLAGPYCTWILAQLGAEVIKIERPTGDAMRRRSIGEGGEPVPFHMVHGNKRSVVVDVKTSRGQELVQQIAAESDVFVENFRPDVVDRLNLGAAALRESNRALVYCSIRGFREGTEYANLAGVDPVAEALGGLASVTGSADGPPLKSGFPIADFGTGMWGALGILAAYIRRLKTGEGDHVKASLLDGVISWSGWHTAYYLMTGANPPRLGSAHLYLAPFEFFKCSDDEYIVVGVGSDHHWRLLCEVIGRLDLFEDSRFSELYERGRRANELRVELIPIFLSRTSTEWVQDIQKVGVPAAPILSIKDVTEGDYAKQSGMIAKVSGFQQDTRVIGFPVEFVSNSLRPPSGGPRLGADTADVLARYCGLDSDEIGRLAREGVIGIRDGDVA
jgi:crotonobetainyl-CoA:carnitine CoA-transferase CaiB-like acyl-CoA transferase